VFLKGRAAWGLANWFGKVDWHFAPDREPSRFAARPQAPSAPGCQGREIVHGAVGRDVPRSAATDREPSRFAARPQAPRAPGSDWRRNSRSRCGRGPSAVRTAPPGLPDGRRTDPNLKNRWGANRSHISQFNNSRTCFIRACSARSCSNRRSYGLTFVATTP